MFSTRRQVLARGHDGGIAPLTAGHAIAQPDYPSKTITMVVSYPPGGDTDAIARLFADKLSQRLKQTVIDRQQARRRRRHRQQLREPRPRTATHCCSRPTPSPPRRW